MAIFTGKKRNGKRTWHFRWPKEVEAKAQTKTSHDEEKVSEVWKCGPHEQHPGDQALQPLVDLLELHETETVQTFEAAVLYDVAHGAGQPGVTRPYAMERA